MVPSVFSERQFVFVFGTAPLWTYSGRICELDSINFSDAEIYGNFQLI